MSTDYKQLLVGENLEVEFAEIGGKEGSEISVELKCHIKNVLSTLREGIEKFKISLILPKILENPKVLQQHLQNTKYNQCLELVKEYRKKNKSQTQTRAHQELNPNDDGTLKIIDYFLGNSQILNVLPNWIDDIDIREKDYLKAFTDVCEIAEERFRRSAIADLANEKRLHAFYLANEETVDNIKRNCLASTHTYILTNFILLPEIKQKIQQKKVNFHWKHAAKSGVIQKLEEELELNQYDNQLLVKREITKGQRKIQSMNNAFTAKQQELEEAVKMARLNYEAKLKQNLSQEKSIQGERNKIQLQLQALIKKYDQTIYDKHVVETLLQEEYDKQKQEFEEFLKEYKKAEELYEELVIRQQRLLEAKALMFAYTRAATRIQKWWRALQKRMAKKRMKQKRKERAAKKEKSTKQVKGQPKKQQ